MGLNGVSFAFITETWLNDNIDDAATYSDLYRNQARQGF